MKVNIELKFTIQIKLRDQLTSLVTLSQILLQRIVFTKAEKSGTQDFTLLQQEICMYLDGTVLIYLALLISGLSPIPSQCVD
jgi:hypothetical protein